MFNLFREYKLENLADLFSDRLRQYSVSCSSDPANWLKPHTVVVQTRGMAEYLRQNTAAQNGIAANLHMPFLNAFTDELFFRLYGSAYAAAAQRSRPDSIRKSVMKLLSSSDFTDSHVPELKKYISGSNAELKRWQLAGKIADLFEQYQIYRANQLEKTFRVSASGRWQKVLYDELFNEKTPGKENFFRKFLQEDLTGEQKSQLPEKFSIFGAGTMPPVFLNIFLKTAQYSEVDFFYLTPCLEFWLDEGESDRNRPEPWECTESVNPILQSLGSAGREFFSAIMANDETVSQIGPTEVFFPDDDHLAGKSMLEVMQFDIVHMFDRRKASSQETEQEMLGKPLPELSGDNSVAIHNCHSLRRELEVLHDELLKLIQQGIKPRDMIVMMPDITASAPLIEAVFGNGELRDVYSIADVPSAGTAAANETFHRILKTASGRFEYSNIISLMDMPLIRQALDLSEKDLVQYSKLMFSAGARWGFDSDSREKICQIPFSEYSWQSACDRLLGGYLTRSSDNDNSMILDDTVNAFPALENSEITTFARLMRFLENLHKLGNNLCQHRSLAEWCDIFSSVLDDFFLHNNDNRTALAPMRSALENLLIMAQDNAVPGTYPLNAALAMFDDTMPASGESGRFLRGKITFCRMMPMRSIPNDVVAILDLHEGSFPRRSNNVGFDLISALPQGGDRDQMAQDRYLLLEALLSARKHLLLFYRGQDAEKNQIRPACAPLNDISKYLENAFGLKEFKHKLSGIDMFYFSGDKPCRSLNMENFTALKASCNIQQKKNFRYNIYGEIHGLEINKPLILDDLITFFRNPCSWVLQKQFKMNIPKDKNKVSTDEEMWNLSSLENWQIENLIINQQLKNISAEKIYNYAKTGNSLPPSTIGKSVFDNLFNKIKPLPEEWQKMLTDMERRPVVCSIEGIGKISGTVLMPPDSSAVLSFRWGKYDSRTALLAVLGQLCAAVALNSPVQARMLNSAPDKYELRFIREITPDMAREKLKQLLLTAGENRSIPLPVFEKASTFYSNLKTAENKFKDAFGDITDPAVALFYSVGHWQQPDFLQDFQNYSAMLYEGIEIEQEQQ